jgi:hypothetical protein
MDFTWSQVTARRFARHHLTTPAASIRSAVASMMGAHAQVMSAAELQVGLRTSGTTRSNVTDALWVERSLVKTYGPRGTVHLLPTADLGVWIGALSAVPVRSGLPAAARLTTTQTDLVVAAITTALEKKALTLDELDAEVIGATGAWAADATVPMFGDLAPRWRQAMARAAAEGALVFAENRGRKSTFIRPPQFTVPDDPATALLQKYLHSYGPATPRQFAQWMAAPVRWAEELFARSALDRVSVDGVECWVAEGDTEFADDPARGILLLPYFDPYIVGSHPRESLFPGATAGRALSGGQAGVFPVMLVDGAIGGVWHQRRAGTRLAITVEPFASLGSRATRQLEGQVSRLGQILEATPTLTVGAIGVGSHA